MEGQELRYAHYIGIDYCFVWNNFINRNFQIIYPGRESTLSHRLYTSHVILPLQFAVVAVRIRRTLHKSGRQHKVSLAFQFKINA